jgi:hypothetical protein
MKLAKEKCGEVLRKDVYSTELMEFLLMPGNMKILSTS